MQEDLQDNKLFELSQEACDKKAKYKAMQLLARREYSKHELYTKLSQKEFSESIITDILLKLEQSNYQSDYRCGQMLLSHGYKSGFGPNKIRMQMQQKGLSAEIIEQTFCHQTKQEIAHGSACFALNLDEKSDLSRNKNNNQQMIEQLQNLISNHEKLGSIKSNALDSNKTISKSSNINQDLDYDWNELAKQVAIKKFGSDFASNIEKDLKNKAKLQRFLYNKGFEQDHINFVIKYYNSI